MDKKYNAELRKSFQYDWEIFSEKIREELPEESSSLSYVTIAKRYEKIKSNSDEKNIDSQDLLLFTFEVVNYLCSRIIESDSVITSTVQSLLSSLGNTFFEAIEDTQLKLANIERQQNEILMSQDLIYKKLDEIRKS